MSYQQLVDNLRDLGIKSDDVIVVHTSFKAIKGETNITPDEVIDALKEVVSEGTLMIPTLSYKNVPVDNPYFNVTDTPACIGIIPETARKRTDGYRSLHPTHSVMIFGQDAKEIAEAHRRDFTPVGPNSPFHEVYRRKGKIVMLGAPLARNTSFHGVEEMIIPSYLYKGNYRYEMTTPDETFVMNVLRHDFEHHAQHYERLLDIVSPDEYMRGQALHADCVVYEAVPVWEKGLEKLKEALYYFVELKEEEN